MASRAEKPLTFESIAARLAACGPPRDPRARLLEHVVGPVSPELERILEQPGRSASVLLGLIDRPGGLTLLFTERAAHLRDHAGQISFPGGRLAADEGPVAAALREAGEEVGLDQRQVTVAGCLDPHLTGTGFVVTPVVGFVAGSFVARPDPAEVAGVFEVPLDYVLEPNAIRVMTRERYGTRFRVYELEYDGRRIWGATAAMLMTFRDVISDDEKS
ncbi:MAG TPA: CoA pyrophosphatase [Gammaproteobacteria bacterium]